MRGPAAAFFALLALGACGRAQPPAEPPAPPTPPPPAPVVDVRRPLNALGTEPFWALKIRPEGLSYSDPETAALEAADPVFTPLPEGGRWTAGAADGRRLTAEVKAAPCEDGMSGVTYAFSAELQVGERRRSGCAAYADAMPRPGG